MISLPVREVVSMLVEFGHQQGVALPQVVKASLKCWPPGIHTWALLFEDLVTTAELLKLNRPVLPSAAHASVAYRGHHSLSSL
jgi:hypothetical protein